MSGDKDQKISKSVLVFFQQRRIHFQKTRTTVNGTTLGGIKRHGRPDFAFCAVDGHLYPLLDSGVLGRQDRRQSLIFGFFAVLAALRSVFQSLVAKKSLFAGRPDKVHVAVDAENFLIREFGILIVGIQFGFVCFACF